MYDVYKTKGEDEEVQNEVKKIARSHIPWFTILLTFVWVCGILFWEIPQLKTRITELEKQVKILSNPPTVLIEKELP